MIYANVLHFVLIFPINQTIHSTFKMILNYDLPILY